MGAQRGDRNKNVKVCKVVGCGKKHSAMGFCNIHYQRSIRGIPIDGNPRPTLMQRIMSKIEVTCNGCWVWTGAKSGGDGREQYRYGYIRVGNKSKRVHRVLYEIVTKDDITGKLLCHKCDNPSCINPDHLFVGTHKDNSDDMMSKGRDYHPRGEDNHSKLTEEDVKEIRKRAANGEAYRSISKDFPISQSYVSSIVTRKKWKHVI